MIIVDTALARRLAERNPVRVAMVGAGYMARGIALQILTAMPGIRLVAVSNRTLPQAQRVYREAGVESTTSVRTVAELERAIAEDRYAVAEDPALLDRKSTRLNSSHLGISYAVFCL